MCEWRARAVVTRGEVMKHIQIEWFRLPRLPWWREPRSTHKQKTPTPLTPARVLVALRAVVRVSYGDVRHVLLVLMQRLGAVRADGLVHLARELLARRSLGARHVGL